MKHLRTALLLVVLLALNGLTYAQDETVKWYFAQELPAEEGNIIAFTIDGQMSRLDITGLIPIWSLDNQSAIGVVIEDNITQVYYLRPDGTVLLEQDENMPIPGIVPLIQDVTAQYAVLHSMTGSWLANIPKNRLEYLGNLQSTFQNDVNFSQDGTQLRYLRIVDEGGVEVIDRKLSTGEERQVFQTVSGGVAIQGTDFGEDWFYLYNNEETGVTTSFLIPIQGGEPQLIAEEMSDTPVTRMMRGNTIYAIQEECEQWCYIEVQPVGDDRKFTFYYPVTAPRVFPILLLDEERLLALNFETREYWIIHEDRSIISTGSSGANVFSNFAEFQFSSDHRWLAAVSTRRPRSIIVWDLENEIMVMRAPLTASGRRVEMLYASGGFLVQQEGERTGVYRYKDGLSIELPGSETGVYFDILADGRVLYNKLMEDNTLPLGVYAYDLDTETFTPILQGIIRVLSDCAIIRDIIRPFDCTLRLSSS